MLKTPFTISLLPKFNAIDVNVVCLELKIIHRTTTIYYHEVTIILIHRNVLTCSTPIWGSEVLFKGFGKKCKKVSFPMLIRG